MKIWLVYYSTKERDSREDSNVHYSWAATADSREIAIAKVAVHYGLDRHSLDAFEMEVI